MLYTLASAESEQQETTPGDCYSGFLLLCIAIAAGNVLQHLSMNQTLEI